MEKIKIRRLFAMLVAIVLISCVLCCSALADVIYEPTNDFYEAHRDEFEYVQRQYYTNAEIGMTELFKAPGGKSRGYAENGVPFTVSWVYTDKDGVDWGIIEYYAFEQTPYMKMADLVPVYDYISFREDHESEFTEYDGDYSEFSGGFYLWTLPRSGVSVMAPSDGFKDLDHIDAVYTDSEGLQWGLVSYYYGERNSWVCISEPVNGNIAAVEYPVPDFYKYDPTKPLKPQTPVKITPIVLAVMAAVIVLTVILVVVKKKKDGVKDV